MNFIQQAYKGRNEWWKYLLISSIVLYPFVSGIVNYLRYYKPSNTYKQFTGDSTGFYTDYLLKSLIYFVVFLVGVKFLHKRSIKSIITSKKSISWWRFVFGFFSWALVTVMYLSISYFQYPESFQLNFKLEPFLRLLLMCLTLVPIRAFFLEIFFRGYLLQGIGILTKSRWVTLLLSGLLYMLIFSINPLLNIVGYDILLFYFVWGLLSSVIAVLDERIELSIGMHVANNVVYLLYITTTWQSFRTDAILLDTSPPKVMYLVYLPVFIFVPAYFFLIKDTYQWKNWSEKLFGKIAKPRSLQ